MDNYKDNTTRLQFNGTTSEEIIVRRGVKQGDPLSPILFNLLIDEAITSICSTFQGVKINNISVQCFAYADDMILVAQTPRDLQSMLNEVVVNLGKRGMELNAGKCRSMTFLTVPSKKKTFLETHHQYRIATEPIPAMKITEMFEYLGEKVGVEGISNHNSLPVNLLSMLQKVRRAPLKPHQKILAITKYIMPIFISKAQKPEVTGKVLCDLDKKVRMCLKKILHIPTQCSNAILYAPRQSGGLGVFSFRHCVPRIMSSRLSRIVNQDELLRNLIQVNTPWVVKVRQLIRPFEESKDSLNTHYTEQLEYSFSGGGMYTMRQRFCHDFFRNPPRYWSGRDFIEATLLRFNLLPVKSMPSVPMEDRWCRGCLHYKESLSHILQQCPLGHKLRLERHDWVQKRLTDVSKKRGWSTAARTTVRAQSGRNYIPDLILTKDDVAIICDVSIAWENNCGLEFWYREKLTKYSQQEFIEALRQQRGLQQHTIRILPLVIGARGGYDPKNRFLIESLGLTFSEKQDLITTAIRGSVLIHKDFMKRVFARTSRNYRGTTDSNIYQ